MANLPVPVPASPPAVKPAHRWELAAQWAQEGGAGSTLRFHTFDPGPMRTATRLKGYPGEVLEQTEPPQAAARALMRVLISDAPSSAWSARAG